MESKIEKNTDDEEKIILVKHKLEKLNEKNSIILIRHG
jgi:hypothetical protein